MAATTSTPATSVDRTRRGPSKRPAGRWLADRIVLIIGVLVLVYTFVPIAYIIGLSSTSFDLTKYGRDLANTNANLTPLVIAGLCYLPITLPLTFAVRRMEAKTARAR